jgi:arsenate reductase
MMRLNELGFEYDAINYILDPPSRSKLVELIGKIEGATVRTVMRTKEPLYQELGLGDDSLTEEQLLDALTEHPSLLQRPIIEYGSRAILARPAEQVEQIREWIE